MLLSVIGCGYLGAVHAAAMASLGHEVVGVDVDPERVRALSAGEPPFFEPGFEELLRASLDSGRLTFTTDLSAVAGSEVHFVAVGTPQGVDGAADLTYVDAAVAGLAEHARPGSLVVGKSTVPVGTAVRLAAHLTARDIALAWNPEFLREGFAIQDTLKPDRIVYGVADGDTSAVDRLDAVYAQALAEGVTRLVVDLPTAELVKVAANAFLATKISFINAMAEIAEVTGADVTALADAIGHDARIGRRFLNAGVGFGGGCLPKDIRAFAARAEELGVGHAVGFLREVDAINLRRRARVVELVADAVGDLAGARVALLGLAFKPDSDDVRDSPALDVARQLRAAGAHVVATDPAARHGAERLLPELEYVVDAATAARGADVVVLLTEWAEYRGLQPADLEPATRVMIDGRNVLDPAAWRAEGWVYRGLGRA
ncbi:UDP-glucose dehydrogenase family protein [Pseudolysinimonas yzui]|uniref:UDP-glucose 6-dehydrogenase n=1 Tax=Pseudolysinimonas yzui TaxID=2708254 RepID=A0A8J3GQG8_9MICO|nr:UDP-glucose/GDP-mannose dehydrogenase family protein [Pseudolysinimonas yzui]GHF15304.1 UDP-glucose 6-dehydrogenase [Pseudolysinimonas yzui]